MYWGTHMGGVVTPQVVNEIKFEVERQINLKHLRGNIIPNIKLLYNIIPFTSFQSSDVCSLDVPWCLPPFLHMFLHLFGSAGGLRRLPGPFRWSPDTGPPAGGACHLGLKSQLVYVGLIKFGPDFGSVVISCCFCLLIFGRVIKWIFCKLCGLPLGISGLMPQKQLKTAQAPVIGLKDLERPGGHRNEWRGTEGAFLVAVHVFLSRCLGFESSKTII